MDMLQLKIFSRVARLQSFTGAARELSISQSQVSRAVSELEAELGTLLVARSTRTVVPTEAGAQYLVRVEEILDQLNDAAQSLRHEELQGVLRISMPTSTAIREIIPRLPRFTERHPKLHLQILLDDRKQDLLRDAVDVAIRIGTLPDSGGTARLLTSYPRLVVAAPSYLERCGTPRSPNDLIVAHRIVHGPAAAVDTAWTFTKTDESVSIDPKTHISFSDNEGAVAAVTAGMGITSIGYWVCRRELNAGTLVQLLRDWQMTPTQVHAYFPLGRATPLAARAFGDFLMGEFAEEMRTREL